METLRSALHQPQAPLAAPGHGRALTGAQSSRLEPPALGEPSGVPEMGQVPPSECGEEGRDPAAAAAPLASQNTRQKERKVVAAHRKKPLISDEGLGQLSHRVSLPRGRRSWPYPPTLQPQAAPLPPSPGASTAETAQPGLRPTAGHAREKEEVLVCSVGLQTARGRKPRS